MLDLDDLDQLLADIDEPAAGQKDGKAPVSREAGREGMAERLAKLQEQGDKMKDLLASDDEEDAREEEEGELDKLLGQAGKAIDEGAARGGNKEGAESGYGDDGLESSASSLHSSAASSPVSSPPSSKAEQETATRHTTQADTADSLSPPTASSPVPSPDEEESGKGGAAGKEEGGDDYDEGFESEGVEDEDAQRVTADEGVSIHQMTAEAPASESQNSYDEYGDDDFDDDEASLSVGHSSKGHATESSATQGRGSLALQTGAGAPHENQEAQTAPTRLKPPMSGNMIAHQLSLLQSGWMQKDSMQQRIYRVAVAKLAKSLIMDVFDECIDAFDAARKRLAEIEAEMRRRNEAGFHQPRTRDIRLAEMKKEKQAVKRKKQVEKEHKNAEIVELAKEKAAKRRQEIKESEKSLAESKERFRRYRERAERKYEQEKQTMLESNRQRVMDIKKQSEQNKQGIQEFIQLKREEEAKTRFVERKELEENEAYRQYQQEVAVTSMRAFINRQKESKKEFLARSKDDIRTMMHSHAVFEDSLRKNELHMTRIGAPRRESKKQKLDSYVKEILPIDRGQTGKPYTDALKLTAAIYFSPCESGTLLPQTKKKVGDLTRTTVGPSNGKRQIQAGQVISTLQDAFFKFQRWRPEGVKIADLVAILNRFNLGARKSQIERLAGEFGIDANDNLDVDDFVEVGVAIFTVMAPDVLVMDADGERRRSKSAEPLNFGKKSLVDLERSCISALGNTNISFTKSQTIQDDLAFHLSGAVKSRKAREREMLMLAYEAMEIQKLREQRPVKEASPKKEEPTATETSKELNTGKGHPARKSQGGFKLGKKDVLGKSDGAQDDDKESLQKTDVSLSDAPAPSNAFMGPSPVLGQSAATEQNQVAASSAAATGPFSFKKPDGGGGASKPFTSGGLAAMPAGAGGQFGNSATKKAEWQHHKHSTQPLQHSTQSLLEGEPFSQSSILHAVSRPESRVSRPRTSNEHSRPMTRQGSRPSSRQTEYREDDIIPTQVLDDQNSGGTTEAFKFKMGGMGPGARKPLDNLSTGSTLEQVREGLNLLPTASQPAPVDMSGLSRVQRMKLLQQQNAAAAPAGDAAQAGAAQDTPTHVSEQQPSDQDRVQPVPVAEASLFPRKPRRGNRPF